jgi:NAD(P) transhydrogenase subunit alpha
MKIGVPKECAPGENRVGLVPDVVKKLVRQKVEIVVEQGAGEKSGHSDAAFEEAGATIEADPAKLFADADVIVKVQRPQKRSEGGDEMEFFKEGQVYIGLTDSLFHPKDAERMAQMKVTVFGMEAVPRTSRAQSMDVLSSQANIGGYKAVIMAAERMPKLMPMLMTAAGTISPAKALIVGAGVAGLQAIATAKRLGAVVHSYDVRPEVKEQIESLGGKFVEIKIEESGSGEGGYAKAVSKETEAKQREALGKVAEGMDLVITTAAVPGRKAPLLINKSNVENMKPGSVIVDMAAITGGNVEGCEAGKEVDINGTTLIGATDLPSLMAFDSSAMYAKNIQNFLALMVSNEGEFTIDWEDDIIEGCCICKDGEIVNARTVSALEAQAAGS